MTARLITLLLIATLPAVAVEQPCPPSPAEVVGFAVLPADTWADGPASGRFTAAGRRRRTPRFHAQPVQGISALRPGPDPGTYWGLPDNGFGTPANSPDFLLRVYLLRPQPRTVDDAGGGEVGVIRFIQLADPDGHFPWRLEREWAGDRRFTGADLDPESLAVAADGSFWIGDEVGPFLLHFDAGGVLVEAPFELPVIPPGGGGEMLRSPHHPALEARGVEPEAPAPATVPASGGVEGLDRAATGDSLLALLEKRVAGDPEGTLRIYRFELGSRSFGSHLHTYRLEDPAHRVGELAAVNGRHVLVLERDDEQGDAASFKRIFRLDLRTGAKRCVADLLHLADPRGLTGFGDPFKLPHATIESLVILDERTLLVATDNNFPSSGARGEGVPNTTEMVWIRLADPLDE